MEELREEFPTQFRILRNGLLFSYQRTIQPNDSSTGEPPKSPDRSTVSKLTFTSSANASSNVPVSIPQSRICVELFLFAFALTSC